MVLFSESVLLDILSLETKIQIHLICQVVAKIYGEKNINVNFAPVESYIRLS